MSDRPRIVFFGTPAFALPALSATLAVADVVAVVTRPDRPAGRGHALQSSPVRIAADAHGLNLMTPEKLTADVIERLGSLHPLAGVLAAYGKILPRALLDVFPHGIINVHPSLLPRHRGAAPVAAALLAGDPQTGVTLIRLDHELDHGPIIAQIEVAIQANEHRPALEHRLAERGGHLLKQSLLPYLNGTIAPHPQPETHATYTTLLRRPDGVLNWSTPAAKLTRQIAAFDPWPGTTTSWNGRRLRILAGHAVPTTTPAPIGTVVAHDRLIGVVCGRDTLALERIQLADGRPIPITDFVRGHPDFVGARLAEHEAPPD